MSKKRLSHILAFLLLIFSVNISYAQNINTLDQFTSTTSPTSAITQRVYGKAVRITGLSSGQNICTDSNGLLTTTGCSSGGGGVAGAISTTTPLANTQVVFSTGVSSIGNDSAFTFNSASDRLTVSYASTTAVTVGNLFVTSPSQGYSYIGSNGLLQTVSTSTLAGQIFSATTFSPNSIITTDSAGNLIATGTQLTVGNLLATSTTATSTFNGAMQIGATAGDHALKITSRSGGYPASNSVGGMVNLTNTNNFGQALNIYSNAGVGRTNDLLNIVNDNVLNDQRGLFITQDGTRSAALFNCTNATRVSGGECVNITDVAGANRTTLGVSGAPVGLGLLKFVVNSGADANASALSVQIDDTDPQGFFVDTIAGYTGKFFNIRNNGTDMMTLSANGLLTTPYSSSTAYASFNVASTTFLRVGLPDGCANITSGLLGSTGSPCSSGGGSGSGTVSTSTPLVSGQVAFSTGVSTIGNDSNFTFDSVSDKLTVSLASTTGLSADFGFFNYINATSTTATSTFAGAVQVGSTAGDHLLKMTASRSHGTGASTGGMVNLNNTLNNSSALTIYSNAGAGQSTLGLQFIKQDNALADTYLQRLDNDGVGRTVLINAINPLSTASVFDIQNTSSGVGININQASTTTTLSPITITNAGMTPGIQITQTNASNSQGAIRIDSATPEIEMVETDQVSPAGKFEMRVNNNVWGVNSRVLADNSFEEVMSLSQLSQGGALTLLYPGVGGYPTKNSRFGIIGINTATTTNYLSISTDGSSGSGQGTPLDDIFVIKGSNGNVGIASSSPSSIFSIGTTNGINFTTATTSFSTTGGINIASGCFSIAGTCISGGGGGGVTSVTATYPMISSGGTTPNITIAFSTTTANIWSALNTFNGGLTIGTTTAGILRTNASGVVYASSASTTISLFNNFTYPDATESSFIQSAQINAPAGVYGGAVYTASSTTVKNGFYGSIVIPDNFASSTAQVKYEWTATSTSNAVVFDFDYRCVGGNNTTSLYRTSWQENKTVTTNNPSTAGYRITSTMDINAGYYCSAGDTMLFYVTRDGADGSDTSTVDTDIYQAVISFLTQ